MFLLRYRIVHDLYIVRSVSDRGTCLVAANIILILLNEICKFKLMGMVVFECTCMTCYRVVAY